MPLACFRTLTIAAWRKCAEPEREERVNYAQTYIGNDGQQIRCPVKISSADDSIAPPEGNGNIEVVGGPYGARNYIVDYGRVLRAEVMHGTVYLQTNVYLPHGGEAVMLLGAPHPTTIFSIGESLFALGAPPLL